LRGQAADYTGPRHAWRTRLVADTLLAAAPPGPLLDAGCGTGSLALALSRTGRTVLACDLDQERCRGAHIRATHTGVALATWLVSADLAALPLGDATIAAAAAGEVLEHVADDRVAVRELARVLRPGGVLVVTVPAGATRCGPPDRAAGHRRRYDRAGLSGLLAGAGLRIESLRSWGFPFGRLYDRWVQRPALAARGTSQGRWWTRLARNRWIRGFWLALFALDERMVAGDHGSGWIAVARRPADRP